MKKSDLKKILSAFLSVTLLISSVAFVHVEAIAAPSVAAGGWHETIYAEVSGVNEADITGVSWTGTSTGALDADGLEYLVRTVGNTVRIDIPGITPGTYSLTVDTNSGSSTADNINVDAYDRSGYAHWNYTEGVGAYNDDGTLKPNAIVLYVTNDTKDTVELSYGGITVTGIGNILNSSGAVAKEPGAKTNTNQGIIKKLAQAGIPLDVRIIGNVTAPAEGLTAFASTDYGGSNSDNGFMARMNGGKDITIEGVGPGAGIDGWGIHFIAQSSDAIAGLGKSFETRNIAFHNVPEDCVGMEGTYADGVEHDVLRCWVHHCEFYRPTIANHTDSDKAGGDGACDFKRGQYFTNSYCYYEGYHKTNLVGSGDSEDAGTQYHLTYHHNYWKNCESRGPLARKANIHMYNNFYEQQISYCMNPRVNCYIFSEYNIFYLCKNPMRVDSGAIKSYNDSLSCCYGDMSGTIVTDKNQKVSSGNTYENFDTDANLSYIPSGDYILEEDLTKLRSELLADSHTMDEHPVKGEDVKDSLIPTDKQATAPVSLPYDKDINSSYITSKGLSTVDNIIFDASKLEASSISIQSGQAISFFVNQRFNIAMTDGGGKSHIVLLNESGKEYITGTGSANGLPPGRYFIQPCDFSIKVDDNDYSYTISYKEAKITHLKIEASDSEDGTIAPPPVVEQPTQSTTQEKEDPSQPTTKPEGGGDSESEETTDQELPAGSPVQMGRFVINKNASGGDYNISEKISNKGGLNCDFRDITSDGGKLKADDGHIISFRLDRTAKFTVNFSGKPIKLNRPDGSTTTLTIDKSPYTEELNAGAYSIEGGDAKSNSAVSEIDFVAVGDAPTVPDVPEDTPLISVGSTSGLKNNTVTVPVSISGVANTGLSSYDVTLTYPADKLTYTKAENKLSDGSSVFKDSKTAEGSVNITCNNIGNLIVTDNTVLFNVQFKLIDTADITVTVNNVAGKDGNALEGSGVSPGKVTLIPPAAASKLGDVDKDKYVTETDAYLTLKHTAGLDNFVITDQESFANADTNSDGKIDMADVIYILGHLEEKPVELPDALKADTYGPADIQAEGSLFTYSAIHSKDKNQFKISNVDLQNNEAEGFLEFKLNQGANITITYQCGSSDTNKAINSVTLTGPGPTDNIVNGNKITGGSTALEKLSGTNLSAGAYRLTFDNEPNPDATLQINSIVVSY